MQFDPRISRMRQSGAQGLGNFVCGLKLFNSRYIRVFSYFLTYTLFKAGAGICDQEDVAEAIERQFFIHIIFDRHNEIKTSFYLIP